MNARVELLQNPACQRHGLLYADILNLYSLRIAYIHKIEILVHMWKSRISDDRFKVYAISMWSAPE